MKAAAVATLLALAACASTPFPAAAPIPEDAALRARLEALLPTPRALTTLQRLILERRGSEFFCTLTAEAERPDTVVMAGLSDLGGTVFRVSSKGGRIEVTRDSPFVRATLARQFLTDLLPLILPPAPGNGELVRLPGGPLGLRTRTAGGEQLRCAGPDGGVRIWSGSNNSTSAILDVTLRGGRPGTISLQGLRGDYRATLEVARWEER